MRRAAACARCGARAVRPVARPVLPARRRPSEGAPARRRGREPRAGRRARRLPRRPRDPGRRRPPARPLRGDASRLRATRRRDPLVGGPCAAGAPRTDAGRPRQGRRALRRGRRRDHRQGAPPVRLGRGATGPPAPASRPPCRGGAALRASRGCVLRLLGRRRAHRRAASRAGPHRRGDRALRGRRPPGRAARAGAGGRRPPPARRGSRCGARLARAGAGRVPRLGGPRRGAVPPPSGGVLRGCRARRRRRRGLGRTGSRPPAALRHRDGAGVGLPPGGPRTTRRSSSRTGRSRRASATRTCSTGRV